MFDSDYICVSHQYSLWENIWLISLQVIWKLSLNNSSVIIEQTFQFGFFPDPVFCVLPS